MPIDENNAILETGADSLRYIALLLCGLDMPFTVLEPPELRNELTALADRLRRAATSEPASQMTHQAMIPEWYHPTMAMTLRLSDDDDALLTSTALAEGRSKQEIARAAIVEYANRRGHLARRDAHIAEIVATDSDLLRRLAE